MSPAIGNNPMVGMTVACAVAIEEVKKRKGLLNYAKTTFGQGRMDGDVKVIVTGDTGTDVITINVPVYALKLLVRLYSFEGIRGLGIHKRYVE